jgi:hypothetical protein
MVIEGSLSYFRTTNQLHTKNVDLVSKTLYVANVSFLSNQILLQTRNAGLFYFDASTFLLINRNPLIKETLVLTSDKIDVCQYVLHNFGDNNIEIIKYSEREGESVYNSSCLKKYK